MKTAKALKNFFKWNRCTTTSKEASKEITATTSDASNSEEAAVVGAAVAVISDTWLAKKEIQSMAESLSAKMKGTVQAHDNDDDRLVQEKRIEMIKDFFRRWTASEWKSTWQLFHGDMEWHFYNQEKKKDAVMSWDAMAEELDKIFAAFPDFHFEYEHLGAASCKTSVVVVQNIQAHGTHTGAPYALGPCEPIEAKGKKVINDPEEFYFFFIGDKIARLCVCPKGEMTGPPGLYTQIGGFPGM